MATPFIATFSVENAHKSDVYALASCPKFTVAASGDGTISLWDNQAPSEELTVLNTNPIPSGIHHMAVDHTGSMLVAVAFDGSLVAFDLKAQAPLSLPQLAKTVKGGWACAIATGGQIAAIATLQGTIFVVDLNEDAVITELTEPVSSADAKRQPCLCVDISWDGKFVAGGYESGKIRIFSIDTGRIAYTLPTHIPRPRCAAFNRQGSVLAVSGNESIALYTLAGGTYLGSLLGHDAFVYSVAFDETGERLLSVAGDGKCKVWSIELRDTLFTLADSSSPLFAGCWLPARSNIIAGAPAGFATAGVDRTIRWYREASGADI